MMEVQDQAWLAVECTDLAAAVLRAHGTLLSLPPPSRATAANNVVYTRIAVHIR